MGCNQKAPAIDDDFKKDKPAPPHAQIIRDSLINKYSSLHEKYRTFWYRTEKECFYDSTRKYGLLYDSLTHYDESQLLKVDTTAFNEPAKCN